ncbi:hypothetical protein VM1G_11415 [Cytospora mali]|uniref:Uncharacterized protein n=1 Tax=Cytospora mali TaxID=578113 RepID=A0A194VPH8_CYTMA|nr:hypothetical protein VM1G_11415 [Valsa mali]
MQQANSVHTDDLTDMNISEVFREAARLHRQMVAVDQRLAELLGGAPPHGEAGRNSRTEEASIDQAGARPSGGWVVVC